MRAKQLLAACMAACIPLVAARADEPGQNLDRPGFELGGRYWYSTGRIGYNYYGDTTSSFLVSRLTYDQLTANSGELYFRGDASWGLFVKGVIGAGSVSGGRLLDEDFPPLTAPYSETTSAASGTLSYGSIDLGYSLVRQPGFRLGGFVGYGRWNESVTASGCAQIAGNPYICQPFPVPTSVALVNETDHWNLLRLGATADVMLGDRVKLTADAAYVHAYQKAVDDHYYTFGVDPASGTGNGFQIDAIIAYQFTSAFNVGVGGRWWHLDTNAIDSFQQLETYRTDRYGAFLQGSYKLN
jgi:hypothetical protein